MSHPYAGQAKSSQKARLKRLGGTAGKSWGSASMYKSKTLPKKNAGSSTPMTISGGSAKSRPDRYASGGNVKSKRRPHATTNIIISHAGGRGGSGGGGGAGPNPSGGPVPVPVPRPVPVPVGAGGPPGAVPIRPPLPAGGAPMPMGAGAMPPRPPIPAGPPPGAMGPGAMGPPPMRPPGMKTGGVIKKAKGGFLEMKEKVPGNTYKGYPRSPTSKVDDAVSAHNAGGTVGGAVKKRADGGGITLTKKLQLGGGTGGGGGGLGQGQASLGSPGGSGLMGVFPGRQPVPAQQGAPNLSGRPMIPAQPAQTAQMPRMGTSVLARPAPGTTSTYAKRGGSIPHGDEKEDRKLFGKMMKEKGISKRKGGGSVNPGSNQTARGLAGSTYHQQGKGFASGGGVGVITNATGGGGGGKARLAKASAARSVPAKTEL